MMGARAGRQFVIDTFDAIEAQAGNEIGRIKALIRASAVADDRDAITDGFRAVGIIPMETRTIESAPGKPFADFLVLTKS